MPYARIIVTDDVRDLIAYVEKASGKVAQSLGAFVQEHGEAIQAGRALPTQTRKELTDVAIVCSVLAKVARILKEEIPAE
jgi:NTP pyrophosphatase (non-canonical NTP hydrolase)